MELDNAAAEVKLKSSLKEMFQLVRKVKDESDCAQSTLLSIEKVHNKARQEGRVTPKWQTKLRRLYTQAKEQSLAERAVLEKALSQLNEIIQQKNCGADRNRHLLRRSDLMSLLATNAVLLPLWIPSRLAEPPPPLCGAIPADSAYLCKPGDQVAARVKSLPTSDGRGHSQESEENWILAEVVSLNTTTNKYEVDDIDSEDGRQRHVLSRRRIVPLPLWKADPERYPDTVFPPLTLVLSLYPRTTCFYRAIVEEPPKTALDDYQVLFEDQNYPGGYAPRLAVAQRYVIVCKRK